VHNNYIEKAVVGGAKTWWKGVKSAAE